MGDPLARCGFRQMANSTSAVVLMPMARKARRKARPACELCQFPSQLVAMLKAWKLKSKFKRPDDLIFPNREGNYIGHDNLIKRQFHPLFETLAAAHKDDPTNISPPPRRFNWHALRHFAVSCWIEAGLTPKTVQTFAGHASLQVTMDRYGHLFPSEDHKKAMDQIARMFHVTRT